jgi:hypothetical protein
MSKITRFIILTLLLIANSESLFGQTLQKIGDYPFSNRYTFVEDQKDLKAYFFLKESEWGQEQGEGFMMERRLNSDGSFILKFGQDTIFTNDLNDPKSALIRAAVPFNDNGWLVGGDFTSWTEEGLDYIAGLDTLGNASNVEISVNGPVSKMWLIHDTLYFSGRFSSVNGQPRNGFAVINTADFSLVEKYLFLTNSVECLADLNDRIAVGRGTPYSWQRHSEGIQYNKFNGEQYGGDLPSPNNDLVGYQSSYDIGRGFLNVSKAISDENGGFFVVGKFSNYGDSARENIVHLNSQGKVSDWKCDIYPGPVYDIELKSDTLYFSGIINEVRGEKRYGYAAVDLITDTLTSLTYTDTPTYDMSEENMQESLNIWDIEIAENTILLRGIMNDRFSTHNVYSISDSLELELLKANNYDYNINSPSASVDESHISISTDEGGWFYQGKDGITKLNSLGEEIDFEVPSILWGGSSSSGASTMDRSGDRVYMGEKSGHSYNWPLDINDVISFNAETGELYPFFTDSEFTSHAGINEVRCLGDTVFLASEKSGGNEDDEAVNFSAYNGVTSENYSIPVAPNGDVYGLEIVNEVIYVYGEFDELSNGEPAHNIVKYDKQTLEIIDTDLGMPYAITHMATDGENIYFSYRTGTSSFAEVFLGAYSIEDESPIDWSPPMEEIEHIEVFSNYILVTGEHMIAGEENFKGTVAYRKNSNLPIKKLFEAVSEWFDGFNFGLSGDWLYPRYSIRNNRVFVAFGMTNLDKRRKERLQLVDKVGNQINGPLGELSNEISSEFTPLVIKAVPDGYLASVRGSSNSAQIFAISEQLISDTLQIANFNSFDDLATIHDTIYAIDKTGLEEAKITVLNPELYEIVAQKAFFINQLSHNLQIDVDSKNVYISGFNKHEVVFGSGNDRIHKATVVGFNRFTGDSLTHLPQYYINDDINLPFYSRHLGIAVNDSNLFVQGPRFDIGADLQIIDKSSEEVLAEYEQDVENMISYGTDLILISNDNSSNNFHSNLIRLDPSTEDSIWSYLLNRSITHAPSRPYKLLVTGDSLIVTGYMRRGYGNNQTTEYVNSFNLNSGEIGITFLDSTIERHPAGADLLGEHLVIASETQDNSYLLDNLKIWNLPNHGNSSFDLNLNSQISPNGIITSGSNLLILMEEGGDVRFLEEGPNHFIYDVSSKTWSSQEALDLMELYEPNEFSYALKTIKSAGSDSLYTFNRLTGIITSVNKLTMELGDSIHTNLVGAYSDLIDGYATANYLYLFAREDIEVFGENRGKVVQIDLNNYTLTDFDPDLPIDNYIADGFIQVIEDSLVFMNGPGDGPLKINIITNDVTELFEGYENSQKLLALGDSILVMSTLYSSNPGFGIDPLIKPLTTINYRTEEEINFEGLDIFSKEYYLNDTLLLIAPWFSSSVHPDPWIYTLYDVKNGQLIVDAQAEPLLEYREGFIGRTVFSNGIFEFDLCSSSVICRDTTIFMNVEESVLLSSEEMVYDFNTTCTMFSPPSYELSKDFFDCSDVGTNDVTLHMTLHGQSATCQSIVSVLDTISPALTCVDTLFSEITTICPEDIITNAQNECQDISFAIEGQEELEPTCDDWNQSLEVQVLATDFSGNISSCITQVVINVLTEDFDNDGVDDLCDLCLGDDSSGDSDSDGICDDSEIAGCQDPEAVNYNPEATDPGPCSYVPLVEFDGPSTIMLPEGGDFGGRPAPNFSVYPNPLKNGELTIFFDDATSGGQLVIYDLLGKVIFGRSLGEDQHSINVGANTFIAEGVYLISYTTSEGPQGQKRLMVTR